MVTKKEMKILKRSVEEWNHYRLHNLVWVVDFNWCDLTGIDLSGADLSECTFVGATMQYCNLEGADLRWSDLSYTDLRSSDLRNADFKNAVLYCTKLNYAKFDNCDLRWSKFKPVFSRNINISCAKTIFMKGKKSIISNIDYTWFMFKHKLRKGSE